jgi:diguanylate cyclase
LSLLPLKHVGASDDERLVSAPRKSWRYRHVVTGTGLVVATSWFAVSIYSEFTGRNLFGLPTLASGLGLLLTITAVAILINRGDAVSISLSQARTDDLTGLANRRRLTETLQQHFASPNPEPLALLLMDLDRFKEVNDSLGHPMGDELLRLIRPRFEAVLTSTDMASRLGGDEFAILLRGGVTEEEALDVARKLRSAIQKPFVLNETDIYLDASFGVAMAPAHADHHDRLLKLADIAMYEAKRNRLGVTAYRGGLEQVSNHRLVVANDLRSALRRTDEIVTYFQPKVDLRTERIVGVEALVRWYHPARGLVPPDDFLQIAEDTGQAAVLTSAVLDRALEQASEWASQGLDMKISVNLYESDLRSSNLIERITTLLEKHVLPARYLQVEITEQSLVEDPAGARIVLTQLSELGVDIALDDYGTGYSSLAYLREFPIDELKLDKTFALGMLNDHTSWIIVRSTIELAHALGLRIVAEGVEDERVRDELITLGCDVGQGYFWAPALPADELDGWLRRRIGSSSSVSVTPTV